MKISYDAFVNWAESRFGDILLRGDEVQLNSIFTEDTKHHMWCSVSGGKYHREGGVYHCWKTDEKGTLVGLVMKVDGCSFEEAKSILTGELPMADIEERLEQYFANGEDQVERIENKVALPPYTYWIYELNQVDKLEAESYIQNRKLSTEGLMYCNSGTYKHRIVIPYYDANGKLIYFNSRHVAKTKIRYLGPPKEVGVGKSDVIFARKWPAKGEKIYLTEGEFDALALDQCGYNGMACGGKVISDKQIGYIQGYKVCLAFDADDAGKTGMVTVAKKLLEKQIVDLTYVRPLPEFKDWNKMLIETKPETINKLIQLTEKPFNEFTIVELTH